MIERFAHTKEIEIRTGLKSFDLDRLQKFVVLAGKNGAGKSRVLNALDYFFPRFKPKGVDDQLEEQIRQAETTSDDRGQLSFYHDKYRDAEHWVLRPESHNSSQVRVIRLFPFVADLKGAHGLSPQEVRARASGARVPGAAMHEFSWHYAQDLFSRLVNAQSLALTTDSKTTEHLQVAWSKFTALVELLVGVTLHTRVPDDPELAFNGRALNESALSNGQKILFQLAVMLHAQDAKLDGGIFVLDEPENHLHPFAIVNVLERLEAASKHTQFWIATHSVPLIAWLVSKQPTCLWSVEDGTVKHAGKSPQRVIEALVGDEDQIARLRNFIDLPGRLAITNFTVECLSRPGIAGATTDDPQVSQISQQLHRLRRNAGHPLLVLDYGAGRGRLLAGLAEATEAGKLAEQFDYVAYDVVPTGKSDCEQEISAAYGSNEARFFSDRSSLKSARTSTKFDVAVLSNVLHEIDPSTWGSLFGPSGFFTEFVEENGYLLIVEDELIPVGELAHRHGFLVLGTAELKLLFGISDEEAKAGCFTVNDARGDQRLMAFLLKHSVLSRYTNNRRSEALEELSKRAKQKISDLRSAQSSDYKSGQALAFWLQQYANAQLALAAS